MQLSKALPKFAVAAVLIALIGVVAYFLNWPLILSLDFSVVWEYRQVLLRGLSLTIILTACAAVLGLLSGTVLAIASQSAFAPLRWGGCRIR